MSYFRSPRTMNERRANQDRRDVPPARASRRPAALPTDWDDVHNQSRKDRNWKRFRQTRYHHRTDTK